MDNYRIYEFTNNLGYIDEKMPDDVYQIILDEIDIAAGRKVAHNTKLVGNIEEQYLMDFKNQINLYKLET